jgi:hypothetical protein
MCSLVIGSSRESEGRDEPAGDIAEDKRSRDGPAGCPWVVLAP